MFQPQNGAAWYLYIVGSFVLTGVLIALLQLIPQRSRRYVIWTVTFLGGLFFALEFFWPVHPMPTPDDPERVGNFLTKYIVPFGSSIAPVVSAFTVGLGVINLFQIHGKRLLKGSAGAINSLAFLVSMFAMLTINILQQAHPNAINKNLNQLIFTGVLNSMDATMFSIIAFYIVSAAYRAFRVRSVEATLLLVTAVLVMIGQTALGQLFTNWLPSDPGNLLHNLRFEIIRDWILNKANTPAVRAINFGLGVGSLAVALRIWLGLERGSYFDSQG